MKNQTAEGKAFESLLELLNEGGSRNRKRAETVATRVERDVENIARRVNSEGKNILGMSGPEVFKYIVVLISAMASTYLAMRTAIDSNEAEIERNRELITEMREELKITGKEHGAKLQDLDKRTDRVNVQLSEISKTVVEIKQDIKPRWRRRK